MDKKLVSTKQSAKVALNKSKSLFDLTNNLLDNKYSGHKFQFYLPIESNLTKNQRIAIDCQAPISIFIYDIFAKKMVLKTYTTVGVISVFALFMCLWSNSMARVRKWATSSSPCAFTNCLAKSIALPPSGSFIIVTSNQGLSSQER